MVVHVTIWIIANSRPLGLAFMLILPFKHRHDEFPIYWHIDVWSTECECHVNMQNNDPKRLIPISCCCIYFCSPVSYTTNIYIYIVYLNIYIYILSRWPFISTTVNYINGWSCMFLFGKHPFTSTKNTQKKTGQPHHPESCCKSRLKLCPARGRCFSCTFQWWPRSLESWWSEIRWWFLLLITLSLILPLSLSVSIIIIIS